MTTFLHIAERKASPRVWIEAFVKELRALGDLTILENGAEMSEDERAARIRECDVLFICWDTAPIPASVAANPGRLQYVCNVTGQLRKYMPIAIIDAGVPVTNWGDAPSRPLAEGAMTLLLACLKDLAGRARIIRSEKWAPDEGLCSGRLDGLNVGVYGCGVTGRVFIELLRPFRPVIRVYDPYVRDLPEGCIAVATLDDLFSQSEAIVIHAGLTDETLHSVTAPLLAKLPRNGIVINTARGAIIDQTALFAELESGRLRAGLDVLEPDRLPPGHPARHWDNLILTAHDLCKWRPLEGFPPARMDTMHAVCLDNVRRFIQGEPLRFLMDRDRYERST